MILDKQTNKKGIAPLFLITIVGLIIAVALIVMFLVSPKLRLIIGGAALVIGGVIAILKYSNNQRLKTFVIASMFIGGLLLIFVFPAFLQSISGYTPLSISKVDVIDGGEKIRIYGVSNGAEQISIYFNPSEINNYINSQGYQATKSVTGSITMTDPTREFYLSKDTSKNFIGFGYYELSLLKNCENNKPFGVKVPVYRVRSTGLCAYELSKGTYSTFTGQTIDNTPVKFNIGGSTGTLNPSSGTNVLTLNDGKTKIEWVGNLANTQGLNTPNYAALFTESNYDRLIDSSSWNSYENLWVDFKTNVEIGLFSTSQAISEFNAFNTQLNRIIQDKTSAYENSVNIQSSTFTSNGLKVDLTTPTVFPTFIITLDASKVGIIELAGKPDIVSCVADKNILSGDTYNTNVRVKNIGSSDGSFYGQVTCTGNSNAGGTVGEQYISAGSTTTIPVQVSGSNTVTGTQDNTCNIKIIDRKSGDSDTCSFNLDVEYQQNIICSPNSQTCRDSETLIQCNSQGTSYTEKDCEFGCIVLAGGESICKGEPPIPPPEECKAYQELKTVNEVDRTWYNYIGIGEPTIITSQQCKTADWVYLVVISGVVLILGTLVIVTSKPQKKSGRKRR